MNNLDSYSACHLDRLKGPEREDAYHSLIEADDAIVPILIKAYRTEAEPAIRATLVEVIWRHRLPETISFLSEALHDNYPGVWKNALDGFVALGIPAAIQILESVKTQMRGANHANSDRIDWINEAIQQIRNQSLA